MRDSVILKDPEPGSYVGDSQLCFFFKIIMYSHFPITVKFFPRNFFSFTVPKSRHVSFILRILKNSENNTVWMVERFLRARSTLLNSVLNNPQRFQCSLEILSVSYEACLMVLFTTLSFFTHSTIWTEERVLGARSTEL